MLRARSGMFAFSVAIPIRVFRNGQPLSLEVTVASREAFEPPQ
jgi:hypothetical protein